MKLSTNPDILPVLWTSTAIIVLLVLVILLFVLFYQHRLMNMKRSETELLLKASLSSEMAERRRIAADLHDSVTGDLGAIRNYMAILIESGGGPAQNPIYANIKDLADEVFRNTREISYKLMPPLLESKGFVAALRSLVMRLSANSTVDFTLETHGEMFELAPNVGYEAFRVIQELTTNINKHGNATKCVIGLMAQNPAKIITVTDDGNPYDFEKCKNAAAGMGLKNIDSRLRAIHANLVQPRTGSGNCIRIVISGSKSKHSQ